MADEFNFGDSVAAPARNCASVTPHNTTELANLPKALFIGGAGTVSLIAADDTVAVSFVCPAGAILPVRAKVVRATGTTATDIVALF